MVIMTLKEWKKEYDKRRKYLLKGFVRISYAQSMESIKTVIRRIERYLTGFKSKGPQNIVSQKQSYCAFDE